jgi:prevent-host-death family protein
MRSSPQLTNCRDTAEQPNGRKHMSRKMSKVSVSDLRKCLADVLNQVRYAEEMVIIFNNGKPFAAIVPLSDAEMLISSHDDVNNFLNGK